MADLVLFEEAFNALGQASHGLILLGHHLAHIDAHSLHDHTVPGCMLLRLLEQVAGLEQRLRAPHRHESFPPSTLHSFEARIPEPLVDSRPIEPTAGVSGSLCPPGG